MWAVVACSGPCSDQLTGAHGNHSGPSRKGNPRRIEGCRTVMQEGDFTLGIGVLLGGERIVLDKGSQPVEGPDDDGFRAPQDDRDVCLELRDHRVDGLRRHGEQQVARREHRDHVAAARILDKSDEQFAVQTFSAQHDVADQCHAPHVILRESCRRHSVIVGPSGDVGKSIGWATVLPLHRFGSLVG